MKKIMWRVTALIICALLTAGNAFAAELLIPGGQVVGLQLCNDTVTVAAFDDKLGAESKAAGLQVGDEIVSLNGKGINSAQDVVDALDRSDGTVEMRVRRNGKEKKLRLCPRITPQGPRLGVFLKDGITGIGTVTWYDPDTGRFGTLGHGVNCPDGDLLEMFSGSAYEAEVASVKRGTAGEPGQLRGAVDTQEEVGKLYRNTQQGVFGIADEAWRGEVLPVGGRYEVRLGQAKIRSTVSGENVQEYSVEILKIYPNSGAEGRNLLLQVTDPVLLEATGGIVQGMSGSPILQDGKLVGAVTHVLVNDPTRGYGIFIENMLDAAG